jgi:hypothetical protein
MQFTKEVGIKKQCIDGSNPKSEEGNNGIFNGLRLNYSHFELDIND